jgi:hypothetical protein
MEEGAELDEYLEKLVDVDESIDVDEVDTPWDEIKRLKNIKFLQDFFADWKSENFSTYTLKSCRTITRRKKLSSININTLNFNAFTFEESIQCVCKEIFRYTYKLEYVIALLAFAIEVDKHLEYESWYATERLISVLAIELVNTPFETNKLYDDDDNDDHDDESNYPMILLIIPTLFMMYFLYK